MAAPATQNLTITRGDTETIVATMTTDGTTPIDVTGRTYTSQMRLSPDEITIAATATCTVSNGPAGQVTVVYSATDTATLLPGFYYWDLQETASGVVTTVLAGTVNVLADVTR